MVFLDFSSTNNEDATGETYPLLTISDSLLQSMLLELIVVDGCKLFLSSSPLRLLFDIKYVLISICFFTHYFQFFSEEIFLLHMIHSVEH